MKYPEVFFCLFVLGKIFWCKVDLKLQESINHKLRIREFLYFQRDSPLLLPPPKNDVYCLKILWAYENAAKH